MKIAVMGYGTVGSGVVELLHINKDAINFSAGEKIELKYILDVKSFPESPYGNLFTDDFEKILNDKEIKLVVETIGGTGFSYDYVKALLSAGKSVVTSNKELVAKYGFELNKIADEKNINFLFEAAVGGGIPIIGPIVRSLNANKITEVAGILNGTTNYILTSMIYKNMSFEEALSSAQSLGYAESDPSNDVDGFDSCRKICILAALCFGVHVYPEDVHTEGIRNISLKDVAYADMMNGVIKLIAYAKRKEDGRIDVAVGPAFVKRSSLLSGVNDVFNAVLIRGNAVGDILLYGRGAGKLPTASAVVSDIIEAAKTDRKLIKSWERSKKDFVTDFSSHKVSLFIRGKSKNRLDTIAELKAKLGEITLVELKNEDETELAFVTPAMSFDVISERLGSVNTFKKLTAIRMTDY